MRLRLVFEEISSSGLGSLSQACWTLTLHGTSFNKGVPTTHAYHILSGSHAHLRKCACAKARPAFMVFTVRCLHSRIAVYTVYVSVPISEHQTLGPPGSSVRDQDVHRTSE